MRKFFWIPEIAYDLRKEGKIFIDKGKFFCFLYRNKELHGLLNTFAILKTCADIIFLYVVIFLIARLLPSNKILE